MGEVLSTHGLTQLRVAETEKYAHVTYFFNAENEKAFKGEKRIIIPSPKVAYYDSAPKMSALAITQKVLASNEDVIIVNFANADMVGHTGDLKAAIKGIECVDACLQRIWEKKGGIMLITADHGNAECMKDSKGRTLTSHTLNDVPFYLLGSKRKLHSGGLSDVAPTVLELLGLSQPKEMTGKSLLKP